MSAHRRAPSSLWGLPLRLGLMCTAMGVLGLGATALAAVAGITVPRFFDMDWWGLIPALVLVSRVTQVRFRGVRTVAPTEAEMPLILAALGGAPMPGVVAATAIALCIDGIVWRRLHPLKILYNVGEYSLRIAIATVGLHLLLDPSQPFGLRGVAAFLVSGACAHAVTHGLWEVMIATGWDGIGGLNRLSWREFLGDPWVAVVEHIGYPSTAALIVSLTTVYPWMLIPAFVVAAIAQGSMRFLQAARRSAEESTFLLEASHKMEASADSAESIAQMLEHVRTRFGPIEARILVGPISEHEAITVVVDGDGDARIEHHSFGARERVFMAFVAAMPGPSRSADLAPLVEWCGLPIIRGVLAPLRRPGHALGALAIIDRDDVRDRFTEDDAYLLNALASQVARTLEHWQLTRTLATVVSERERLVQESTHDPLTGLANRRLLSERLDEAVARSHRSGATIAVLLIDLDGFKGVNDVFGHKAGDDVLVEVARRIRGVLREVDLAARLGGDEFAVILESPRTARAAQIVAERIVDAVAEPIGLDNGSAGVVGASVGLCVSPGADRTDGETLLDQADAAMYEAKRRGRGQVVSVDQSGDETIRAEPGRSAAS